MLCGLREANLFPIASGRFAHEHSRVSQSLTTSIPESQTAILKAIDNIIKTIDVSLTFLSLSSIFPEHASTQ